MAGTKGQYKPMDATDVLMAMLRRFAERAGTARCVIHPRVLTEFVDIYSKTVLLGIRRKPRESQRVGRRYLENAIDEIARRAVEGAERRPWGKIITVRVLKKAANDVIKELYKAARKQFGPRLLSPFCFWWRAK